MPRNLRNIFYTKKWFYLFLLTFFWFFIAFLVNPVGEFPLNDDWAYSKNVYDLAVNGILKFSNWPAMILIAQTLWGTLFCKIFGFSFTVLRLSVLLLGWGGIITFYLLIRKFCLNDFPAFLFTLILAINPFYFSLSYTFMTEVPFLVFTIGALYFYFRHFKDQKLKYLLLATGCALIATMIRQLGMWIAITMILTYLLSGRINLKRLSYYVLSAGFIIAVLYSFTAFLKIRNILPASYASFNDLLHSLNLKVFLENMSINRLSLLFFYSGLLLLPLVIYILPSFWRSLKPMARWIAGSVSILCTVPIILTSKPFPCGNIINNLGLGPRLVKDAFCGINIHPLLFPGLLKIIYIPGTIGIVFLIFTLIVSLFKMKGLSGNSPERMMKVQTLLLIGGNLIFLLLYSSFFDRYFLPVILCFILLLTSSKIKAYTWNKAVSMVLFLCLAFFSVSATHDYLSFNRARWEGLNDLISYGISPKNIDGGFEFNGWYETGELNPLAVENKSWYWVNDDSYLIAFGNICGYNKVESKAYNCFLRLSKENILILKRNSQYQDSIVISCGAEIVSKNKNAFVTSDSAVLIEDTLTRTDKESRSGKYSIILDKKQPTGFRVNLKDIQHCEKFRVSVWCKGNQDNKAGIIFKCPDVKWLDKWANVPKAIDGDWQLLEIEVPLYFDYPYPEIWVYMWNTGENKVFFDDLRIVRYQNPEF